MYTLLNPDTGEEIPGYKSVRLLDVVRSAKCLHAGGLPACPARETSDGAFVYLVEPQDAETIVPYQRSHGQIMIQCPGCSSLDADWIQSLAVYPIGETRYVEARHCVLCQATWEDVFGVQGWRNLAYPERGEYR